MSSKETFYSGHFNRSNVFRVFKELLHIGLATHNFQKCFIYLCIDTLLPVACGINGSSTSEPAEFGRY